MIIFLLFDIIVYGDRMKIIIVGIGKLGEFLVRSLVKEDNEITLVDVDFTTSMDVINNEDVNYVHGSGLDANVLVEAGVGDADLLISVMENDEQNVMCSLLGKKLGAKHTIARIRTPEYSNSVNILKDELGLSMLINPELLAAAHIARALSIPSAMEATTFLKGRIQLVSFKVKEKSPIDKITVSDISRKVNNLIICAIERDEKIIVPSGNTKLQSEDKIYVSGTTKAINEFLIFSELIQEKTKRVMISGGSSTAVYLAQSLLDMGMQVKIIEINEERCKELSEKIPKALIIHGDASDQNVLFEEGIENMDAFVALTSIDEENIVYSMFAAMHKVPKIITKINHINLDGIVEKTHIDAVITPHKIASNQIVKYVRAMIDSDKSSCEAIYSVDDAFEMLEFNIKDDFRELNKKIRDINFKEGLLIIAMMRGKSIIFPTGNDIIKEGDTVVVIDTKDELRDINDILD